LIQEEASDITTTANPAHEGVVYWARKCEASGDFQPPGEELDASDKTSPGKEQGSSNTSSPLKDIKIQVPFFYSKSQI